MIIPKKKKQLIRHEHVYKNKPFGFGPQLLGFIQPTSCASIVKTNKLQKDL